MDPGRWQRVARLYELVLEREPDERGAFLAGASGGDEELRREVESLVAQEHAQLLIDQPVLEAAASLLDDSSNLESGSLLGPYRINHLVGAGGMGQVYHATDTRLNRAVAIKVLPPMLAADAQARARFEREAGVIARLPHPHICTLYDVGHERLRPDRGAAVPNEAATSGVLRERSGEAALPREREQGTASGERDVDFLVMEYLEGETVEARLEKGPLPLDQALRYAMEIADALTAAHRQGIVHRDLKPSNIFLAARLAHFSGGEVSRPHVQVGSVSPPRAEGGSALAPGPSTARRRSAKLLDFGLAKVLSASIASGDPLTGTTPPSLTGQGTILGTFQYMAPEQLEGNAADTRTDIFAFGAVVYEMVTARKAFEGKSRASLIGVIMHGEPPPISAVLESAAGELLGPQRSTEWPAGAGNAATTLRRPAEGKRGEAATLIESAQAWSLSSIRSLERIVKTCLAKDPDDRWQSARDLLRELQWLSDDGAAVAATADSRRVEVLEAERQTSVWRRVTPFAATAVVVALVSTATVWNLRTSMPAGIARFSFALPEGQRDRGRHIITVSPDGSQIVFVAHNGLYRRDLADGEIHSIQTPGARGVSEPFFSTDGQWIGFFDPEDGKLKKIAAAGGAPVEIVTIAAPFGASWGPDNRILIGQGPHGILRVSADGGEPETIITVEPGELADGPQMLPDGEHVLFTVASDDRSGNPWDTARIVVQSLKSRERKVLIHGGSDAHYVPATRHIVYAYGSTLRSVPFDVNRLRVTGEADSVVEGVRRAGITGATGAAQFGLSSNGTMAYITGGIVRVERRLTLFDLSGAVKVLDSLQGLTRSPRFSADGQQIALRGGDGNIWIHDVRGTRAKRNLTFDGQTDAPVWTPDGRIVFQSTRDGDRSLFWQRADESTPPERLTTAEPGFAHVPNSVSRDGKTLLFLRIAAAREVTFSPSRGQQEGLWMLPIDGDRTPKMLIEAKTGEIFFSAVFSADGRWIAYEWQPAGGKSSIYVEPFPRTGARYQIATECCWNPMWSPDGTQLLYLGGARRDFLSVPILRKETNFEYGTPRILFSTERRIQTIAYGLIADVSPDGMQIVAFTDDSSDRDTDQRQPSVNVVLNWFRELRERVPPGR